MRIVKIFEDIPYYGYKKAQEVTKKFINMPIQLITVTFCNYCVLFIPNKLILKYCI